MSEEQPNNSSHDTNQPDPPSSESAEPSSGASGGSEEAAGMDLLRTLLARFNLGDQGEEGAAPPKPEQLLDELTVEGIARFIKSDKCKKIIVMTGAGISTSAGIPDFRSPGTGLYDNLQKFNLPNPQAIFEIGFFRENPDPFFTLAKELYPGQFKPTPSHYFIKLLADKGLLLRAYTQNIDTLERVAGVPGDLMVEAHGTFHTGHCLECTKEYSQEWMKEEIFADKTPKCADCEGVVKPDIVFFGESLPPRFFIAKEDFPSCDMLIIMGTSLVVQPFASLVDRVDETTPRLLINMEKTGESNPMMALLGMGGGLDFDSKDKYRDVAYIGTCDDGCYKLAELLGWKEELQELVAKEHAKIDAAKASTSVAAATATTKVVTPATSTSTATTTSTTTTMTTKETGENEPKSQSEKSIPSEKL